MIKITSFYSGNALYKGNNIPVEVRYLFMYICLIFTQFEH